MSGFEFFLMFIQVLVLFGYQSVLEQKGINDPTLAISLYKTSIVLDISTKLLLCCFVDKLSIYAYVSSFLIFFLFLCFLVNLSLGISKKSLRKFRKFPLETNYTICALKVVGWGLVSILFNVSLLLLFADYINGSNSAIIGHFLFCGTMVLIILPYVISAAVSLIRLDRLKYPSTRSLNALSNNNSPIILLRSFKIDSFPSLSGKVFDEAICEVLDLEKNPIISLANPDEILPSGGSLKIQAKDSEWKEVVKEVLKSCRAVILVEGLSEGLHWEISILKEFLHNEQLYVLVPPKKYRELAWCHNDEAGTGLYSILRNFHNIITKVTFGSKKEKKNILNSVWGDFSSKLQQFGINSPNIFPGENSLLCFDEQWNGKKVEGLSRIDEILNLIVERTSEFNTPEFDYPKLGEKIASFEVNGFLNKEEIAPYKKLVDRFVRIGYVVSFIFFVAFIVLFLF